MILYLYDVNSFRKAVCINGNTAKLSKKLDDSELSEEG
jgi:hypothetical protein